MKKRTAASRRSTSTVVHELPPGLAASVGRMIARRSYLDWVLTTILCALLAVPIRQGRAAIRIPPPRLYIATVGDLLAFLRLHLPFNLRALERKLVAADQAGNIMVHSVFVRDERSGRICVQPVSGAWEDADSLETPRSVHAAEKIELTRAFLGAQRAAIDDAIAATRELAEKISDGLQALNETRRTRRALDRRHER